MKKTTNVFDLFFSVNNIEIKETKVFLSAFFELLFS